MKVANLKGSTRKMDRINDYIGSALIIAMAIFMYVFVIQIVNDATCPALGRADSPPAIVRDVIYLLGLCWW